MTNKVPTLKDTQDRAHALSVIDNERYEMVSMLENVLERAKSGEFKIVSFAAVTKSGANVTGWSTPLPGDGLTKLIGATSYLEYRMNKIMDEDLI